MTITDERQRIARTILDQLGGQRALVVMTGAKDFLALESGVQFKIMRNAKNVTTVRITLNASDTYDMEFGKIRKYEYTVLSTNEGVYFDMLKGLFEEATGLFLEIPTIQNVRPGY